MKLRTYSTNGRSHLMLGRLADGDATFADLCEAAGAQGGKPRHKAFMALSSMREDGFVRYQPPGSYSITVAGQATLDELRAGRNVQTDAAKPVRPNVRLFGAGEADDAAGDMEAAKNPSRLVA